MKGKNSLKASNQNMQTNYVGLEKTFLTVQSYCREFVKNSTKLISGYQNLPMQIEIKIYWREQLSNISNYSL